MKPRFSFSHWIFALPWMGAYSGICLGRWVCFRKPRNETPDHLIRHEMVHQQQMDRYSVPGFYVLYAWYYVTGLIRLRSHDLAYEAIPLEVDAYARQNDATVPLG